MIKEVGKYCNVNVVVMGEDNWFISVFVFEFWLVSGNVDYLYYIFNEIIGGVEFDFILEVEMDLVVDFLFIILFCLLDVSCFGLIYVGV